MRSTDGWQLWIPLAAIPALWSAQELLAWFLASNACPGARATAHAGIAIPTAGVLIAAVVAIASSLARWRAGAGAVSLVRERRALVAFASLLFASALGLGLVYAGLPALGTSGCEALR